MSNSKWVDSAIEVITDSEFYRQHIPDEFWGSIPLPAVQKEDVVLTMYFGGTRAAAKRRVPMPPRFCSQVRYPERQIEWQELPAGAFVVNEDDLRLLDDPQVVARLRTLLPIRAQLLARHRELQEKLLKFHWLVRGDVNNDETRAVAKEWSPLLDKIIEPQFEWLYKVIAQPLRDWVKSHTE